jgi:hypothetical protein
MLSPEAENIAVMRQSEVELGDERLHFQNKGSNDPVHKKSAGK